MGIYLFDMWAEYVNWREITRNCLSFTCVVFIERNYLRGFFPPNCIAVQLNLNMGTRYR